MLHDSFLINIRRMQINKFLKSHLFSEKGITMLLTVFVLGSVLAIASALATTVVIQLRVAGATEDSTVAVFASDAGIECKLRELRYADITCPASGDLGGGLGYDLTTPPASECGSGITTCIKSVGKYRATRRGIEATY